MNQIAQWQINIKLTYIKFTSINTRFEYNFATVGNTFLEV